MMRAVHYTHYGAPEVLHMGTLELPPLPAKQIRVKMRACTVSTADIRMRDGSRQMLPFWPISKLAIGLRKPRNSILGVDFAGEVVEIGDAVQRFKVGDAVFGMCGGGAYADMMQMPEDGAVALMPPTLSYAEAASLPFGSLSALYFLRQGGIDKRQKVLIYGASGSVGTAAVQIAQYLGASVTAVCSAKNADLVRNLGADEVIDYTREDFGTRGGQYDIVLDTLGKTTATQARQALKANGRYVQLVFSFRELGLWLRMRLFGQQRLVIAVNPDLSEDLAYLSELVAGGHLRPVIDRSYPLDEVVAAHHYVGLGHKVGNVVLNIAP